MQPGGDSEEVGVERQVGNSEYRGCYERNRNRGTGKTRNIVFNVFYTASTSVTN